MKWEYFQNIATIYIIENREYWFSSKLHTKQLILKQNSLCILDVLVFQFFKSVQYSNKSMQWTKVLNRNSILTRKGKHEKRYSLQGRPSLESKRKLSVIVVSNQNNKTFQCTHIYTPTSTHIQWSIIWIATVYMCACAFIYKSN